jgi:hypothetical protein
MSLEDKIINPMAPAELPGQGSEPLPKAGKKRRKGGGTAGAAAGKAKKGDLDDEVGGDSTAVLTLGSSEQARRPQKKMLFESASEGATLSFAGPAIRPQTAAVAPAITPKAPAAKEKRETAPAAPQTARVEPVPAPVAATPAAVVKEIVPTTPVEVKPVEMPAPAPVAATPAAEIKEVAPTAPVEAKPVTPAPAPKSNDAAAIATMKGSVFQVAAVVMREPEPQPKDEAPVEPELPLPLEPEKVAVAETPAEVAPVAQPKIEPIFEDSLTLAFDATLADGLAERAAAVEEEIAPTPVMPAAAPSPAPEPIAAVAPEPPAPVIKTAARAEPSPVAAPAPVAPVVVAPTPEQKPESEPPSRGLSRSEAIARAARLSARATPRPVPTAAETLAAARTAQQQLRSADLPKNPGDIYGYWTRVKNGRRFPSRADFDAEQVAEHWPNSMLLTCGGIGVGTHGNFSSVLRMGANRRNRPDDDLNFTSMITEWILATGGEAVRAGAPVQDTEVFPTPDGTHAYKIVALPLSENQTRVDHVLCHLSRS